MTIDPTGTRPPKPPAALGKTPLGIFTLGALGFAAWRMQDSFVGSKAKAEQKIAGMKVENDYKNMEYQWGQWSGNPTMDHLSDKYEGLKQYGPFRLREHYNAARIHVQEFFGNVIGPNLLPLGVGLAGLYGTIGHTQMKKYGSDFAKWWNKSSFFNTQAWKTLKGVGRSIRSGLWTTVKEPTKLAFKSPSHFAVASGIALVGAFFVKKFRDTNSGDAQRDYYRNDVYSSHDEFL